MASEIQLKSGVGLYFASSNGGFIVRRNALQYDEEFVKEVALRPFYSTNPNNHVTQVFQKTTAYISNVRSHLPGDVSPIEIYNRALATLTTLEDAEGPFYKIALNLPALPDSFQVSMITGFDVVKLYSAGERVVYNGQTYRCDYDIYQGTATVQPVTFSKQ